MQTTLNRNTATPLRNALISHSGRPVQTLPTHVQTNSLFYVHLHSNAERAMLIVQVWSLVRMGITSVRQRYVSSQRQCVVSSRSRHVQQDRFYVETYRVRIRYQNVRL